MSEYLDEQLIEGFALEVEQQLGEAIQFAVQYRRGLGERDVNELRQAAQDSLAEILPVLVDALESAYAKSELAEDYVAIAMLFQRLAIRAKLKMLLHIPRSPGVHIVTRKATYAGLLLGMGDNDGVFSIRLLTNESDEPTWVPFDSVQDVST
jgi:hypothetical protein